MLTTAGVELTSYLCICKVSQSSINVIDQQTCHLASYLPQRRSLLQQRRGRRPEHGSRHGPKFVWPMQNHFADLSAGALGSIPCCKATAAEQIAQLHDCRATQPVAVMWQSHTGRARKAACRLAYMVLHDTGQVWPDGTLHISHDTSTFCRRMLSAGCSTCCLQTIP